MVITCMGRMKSYGQVQVDEEEEMKDFYELFVEKLCCR